MAKNMTTVRRIASHWALTPQGLLKNPLIGVDGEGVITEVSSCEHVDSQAGVEHYSGMLIPGMVNAHCHLELSHMRGLIGEACGFTGFIKGMRDNRNVADIESKRSAAEFYDARMWHDGVQAIADICNSTLTLSLKSRSKINYSSYAELFGLTADSIKPLEGLLAEAERLSLRCGVTPHSTYSLSEAGWKAAVDASDRQMPLSVHFMESAGENGLYSGRGELWTWYEQQGYAVDFAHYGSAAGRICSTIEPGRKIMLVHNTYIDRTAIEMLVDALGAENITFVLCPRSNMYIEGKLPPFDLLAGCGVNIAIGTDSLASNRSLSMIDELKLISDQPLERLLGWATIGGARALGLDRVGEFREGSASGVVLLTDFDQNNMCLNPSSRTVRLV